MAMEMECCECCMKSMEDGERSSEITSCVEMMSECFSVQLELRSVCGACVSRTKECLAFKRLVETTQETLRTQKANFVTIKTDIDDDGKTSWPDGGNDYMENEAIHSDDDEKVTVKPLKSKKHSCIICPKSFASRSDLRTHVEKHKSTVMKTYYIKCKECPVTVLDQKALTRHMSSHAKFIKCPQPECGAILKDCSYKQHMNVLHGGFLPYTCQVAYCTDRFKTCFKRWTHMRDVHNMDNFKHQCAHCPNKYPTSSMRDNHTRQVHMRSETKSVTCHVCAYQCHSTPQLRAHMYRHEGEKAHRCSVCAKMFVRKKTLTQHMKIHFNYKALKCPLCDKGFTHRVTLRGHTLKVHNQLLDDINKNKEKPAGEP